MADRHDADSAGPDTTNAIRAVSPRSGLPSQRCVGATYTAAGSYWSADRQRFVAEGTVGYNANGKRVTRKGYGTSETAALRELRRKVKDYESGLVTASDRVTVWQVVEDWLDHGQTNGGVEHPE